MSSAIQSNGYSEADLPYTNIDDFPDGEAGFETTGHYEKIRSGEIRDDPPVTDYVVHEVLTNGWVEIHNEDANKRVIQANVDDNRWTLIVALNTAEGIPEHVCKEQCEVERLVLISAFSSRHGDPSPQQRTTQAYFDRKRAE